MPYPLPACDGGTAIAGPVGAIMPDLPLRSFVVGISDYAERKQLPGARVDAVSVRAKLKELGCPEEIIKCKAGWIQTETLKAEVDDWIDEVHVLAKKGGIPNGAVVLAWFSCHGLLGANGFPLLLASDSPGENADAAKTALCGWEDLIEGIRRIRVGPRQPPGVGMIGETSFPS